MQTDGPYKRKLLNFSIKRDMQFKMIGKIFLILFVSLLLSGAIFYQFANQEITSSFQMFHIKARNFLDFLFPVVLSSFAISLVAGVIGSLFFPKPIAGGLYHIEKDLQKVLDHNDLTVQMKLRDGDQLIPLADQLNQLLLNLRGTVQALNQDIGTMGEETDPQVINEKLNQCKEALAQFKINEETGQQG